jgi:ribonuclease Z
MHTDHVLGVVGLTRTLQLQGRTETLRLWGPRGTARVLRQWSGFGGERLGYAVEITEVDPGVAVARKEYAVVPFAVEHRGASAVGYALVEDERRGRFNPDLARELGIPEGPLWGQIHRGRAVTLDDGRVIEPDVLVGPTRRGRRVVVTGDTRPCDATVAASADADLLVHEATFGDDEGARAVETGHSTAREAAAVAQRAGAARLALTHISARYSRDTSELEQQAREVFAHTSVVRDGTEIEVPYREA